MQAPLSADTTDDYEFTVTGGEATITRYTGPGGDVVIPSTLDGYPVVAIARVNISERGGAFQLNQSLTSITIPETVTIIGDHAFWGCTNLTNVEIGSNVTTIASSAFRGCTRLANVKIPSSVTSIRSLAFRGCTMLESVEIPDSVTEIGDSAFRDCTSLTEITIPNSLSSIGQSVFRGCTALTDVESGSSVITIGNSAFQDCTALTSINIPSNVTTIGSSAFRGNSGLTSVNIPEGVTSIGASAFRDCVNLITIDLPQSLDSIGAWAFLNCTNLTNLNVPSGVTSIGSWAFRYCTSLKRAVFRGSVPSMGPDVFTDTASAFSVFYFDEAAGFTSPTWEGYPAINLGSPRSFTDWLIENEVLSSTYTDPASDLNHDGVNLLMAYALDLEPRENLSASMPQAAFSEEELTMTFFGDQPGVTYAVELSTDLINWSTEEVVLSEPDSEGIRSATVDTDGIEAAFLRLVVEDTAP